MLALLALGAVALGGIALMERGRIPAGTTVAGVDVGRKTREEARRTIRRAVRPMIARPIRLLGTGGEATTSGSELGARPLVDAALDEALDTGRFDRVLRRLGIGNARKLGLAYRLGPVRAAEVANRLDRVFGEPARNARVVIGERETTIEPPSPGTRIDRGALRSGLRTLPPELGLPLRKVPPAVGVSAARRAKRTVDRLLDGPRSVRFQDVEAPLSVSLLRSLIVTAPLGREIVVGLDSQRLRAALLPGLGRFETPPRDARFTVDGPRVRIVPSVPGRELAAARIGASLVSNLRAVAHRARFTSSEPALPTAAARKLRITEPVSEFTTNYPCCPSRVTNIKRAAALLDGTVIAPGKEFSLNGALGKRTVAKGFVSAPQIFNGRLEDAVGGGISQVSTTLYNAAFFAGLELVAHQAHQFYISRYPMGREATISWGGPEMIFRNDWPAAILMKLYASDSGITVRFYSTKLGRRVETTTGKPYALTAPKTITISNPSLPPGSRTVVQEAGPAGFSVRYTRKVFRGAKRIRNENYTVKYDAENAIIESGPPKQAKPGAKVKPAPPSQ